MTRTLPLAALLLAACAPVGPEDDFAGILPDDRIRVDLPEGGARAAAGDPSAYQALTRDVTHDVNELIDVVLATVDEITDFEPTWTTGDETTALWGPWTDAGVDGRLWVTRHADDSWTWAVEGRPAGSGDEAWIAIVAGEVDAGAIESAGSGRFALDFDAVTTLDPGEALTGAFYVEYAVDDDDVVATAGFEGVSEAAGPLADAAYHYEQTVGVEGMMDLAVSADATGNGTPELHIVRSRWLSTGEGRADAYLTEGDFGALVYTATECWDGAHEVVFYEDNATFTTSGDEARCAFEEPAFDEEAAPGA